MNYIKSDTIHDNHLAGMLKKYLRQHPEPKLNSIYYCGSQVIKQMGTQPAVFVLSNGDQSQLFGVTHCHSSWSCPRCTAITMAKYGAKIACAIDALAKWHKQSAFMVTFTLPHTKHFKAETIFNILTNAWRRFTRNGNHKARLRGSDRKKATLRGNDPFGAFRENLHVKHNVRVYEFTWSKAFGWHPHIHALFWVPNENWHLISDYEEILHERWWECCRLASIEILSKIYPLNKNQIIESVNEFYNDRRKYPTTGHRAVFFSRDNKGCVVKQKSSYYISGWTGDMEISTGYSKNARQGHFSPHQLLIEADKNPDRREMYLSMFVEYALATKSKRRVQFSNSGLNKIINQWQKTESYTETLKKKATEAVAKPYRVVCWFTEKQWFDICILETETNHEIICKILTLARLPNGKQLIENLLLQYDIDITKNMPHRDIPIAESIFNLTDYTAA